MRTQASVGIPHSSLPLLTVTSAVISTMHVYPYLKATEYPANLLVSKSQTVGGQILHKTWLPVRIFKANV